MEGKRERGALLYFKSLAKILIAITHSFFCPMLRILLTYGLQQYIEENTAAVQGWAKKEMR